jgi:hypothetical protein
MAKVSYKAMGFASPEAYAAEIKRKAKSGEDYTNKSEAMQFMRENPKLFKATPAAAAKKETPKPIKTMPGKLGGLKLPVLPKIETVEERKRAARAKMEQTSTRKAR